MLAANNAAIEYVYLLNLANNQIYLISEIDAIDIDEANIKNAYIPEISQPVIS